MFGIQLHVSNSLRTIKILFSSGMETILNYILYVLASLKNHTFIHIYVELKHSDEHVLTEYCVPSSLERL